MDQVLITCFEPFGGRSSNASSEAVSLLPPTVGPFELHKLCLPVAFRNAADRAIAAIDELVALNLRTARIPDNAGFQPIDEPVVEGGENALFSTLPVRKMTEAISAAGIPAEVSYTAGTYVCNDLFYLVLDHLKGSGVPAGFIHVPADGGLSAQQLAAGLEAAIKVLLP